MLLCRVVFCYLMFGIGAKLSGAFVFFCFIWIGQSRVLGVSMCSGVAFQPAHCTVLLKNLTAASISSSVIRVTLRVGFSLTM
jgi:hypothetical protein